MKTFLDYFMLVLNRTENCRGINGFRLFEWQRFRTFFRGYEIDPSISTLQWYDSE